MFIDAFQGDLVLTLKSGPKIGLYVHLPFCEQKCGYCDFVITLDRTDRQRRRFFEAFQTELSYARERYGRLFFDTLYLGGGTPSLLNKEEMSWLIGALRENFDFAKDGEWTCEFNPGDADDAKIKAFRQLGINRVSLGAQAFQNPLLQAMGRSHQVRHIEETVKLLCDHGILNMSFDLISGLPQQSLENFRESLERTVELEPKQISLYDLDLHDNTPWGIQHREGKLPLPEEPLRAEMFELAIEILTDAGYEQYEISTFARPGFEAKHNLIYWHNGEYLGLGPGAYSYMEGVRYQLARTVPEYLAKCEAHDWTASVADHLTEEQKETETLMTGLRLKKGIDLERFKIIRKKIEDRVRVLRDNQLVEVSGGRMTLTTRGRFLAEQTFGLLIGSC